MTSADEIPRYEIPEQVYETDEPETGACWNCGHMAEVKIGGKTYCLCVLDRDVSACGDLSLCDPTLRDCLDWEES